MSAIARAFEKSVKEDRDNQLRALLPCPFCGGESKMEQTGRNQFTIMCKSCSVRYIQRVLHQTLEWLESTMIEHWNTRTEISELVGLRDSLSAWATLWAHICGSWR